MTRFLLLFLSLTSLLIAEQKLVPVPKIAEKESRVVIYDQDIIDTASFSLAPGYCYQAIDNHVENFPTIHGSFFQQYDRFVVDFNGSFGEQIDKVIQKAPLRYAIANAYFALGVAYPFFENKLIISPLLGGGIEANWTNTESQRQMYTGPFIGILTQITPFAKTSFNLGYSYHFVQFQEKNVDQGVFHRNTAIAKTFRARGHRAIGNFFYSLRDQLSLGIATAFAFLETGNVIAREKRKESMVNEDTVTTRGRKMINHSLLTFSASLQAKFLF